MRVNQPVTGRERGFDDDVQIISTTNLKGVITYANPAFVEVSGFSLAELQGQPHNIVRHPDMPEQAFADLWRHLKANKPWLGVVKNRCKNGDHYWVSAYVMPMFKNGEVVGYESVRTRPARQVVERAARIYEALRAGRRIVSRFNPGYATRLRVAMAACCLPAIGAAASYGGAGPVTLAAVATSGLLCASLGALLARPVQRLAAVGRAVYDNPLASLVYTGRSDEIGQIETGIRVLEARLHTVTGRLTDTAAQLAQLANETRTAAETNESSVDVQRRETEQVATAVNEMSATVQEIARNTVNAKTKAEEAQAAASHGRKVVQHASEAIETMAEEVAQAAGTVTQLGEQSKDIGMVVNVIRDIAEQTNLLALNAAIEAARAGEYGRGFAVVADEVRKLASNTQSSTTRINEIVEGLRRGAAAAAESMARGQARTSEAVERAVEAGVALTAIGESVSRITDMNVQVASAVEEQAAVAEEINRNISNINRSTEDLARLAKSTTRQSEDLLRLVLEMEDMTSRFAT